MIHNEPTANDMLDGIIKHKKRITFITNTKTRISIFFSVITLKSSIFVRKHLSPVNNLT